MLISFDKMDNGHDDFFRKWFAFQASSEYGNEVSAATYQGLLAGCN
jgi:hypothetical protein